MELSGGCVGPICPACCWLGHVIQSGCGPGCKGSGSRLGAAWSTRKSHVPFGSRKPVLGRPVESTQYASRKFRQRLWRYRVTQSMSRRGNCWDSAPMARLFRGLKSEWIPPLGYRNLPEAQRDVGGYLMGYYNRQRPHTFNSGLSPVASEENLKILSGIS